MLLEGLHIPLTTPFHRDGSLDTGALVANVLRYSLTPAAGLILLGPPAEPTLLTDEETREALRTAAQAAAPEKVLIAGMARDSVDATLKLADYAAEQGYDAILVGAPAFLAPEHNSWRIASKELLAAAAKRAALELRTFFQTVADRSPLPVILHNVPGRTLSLSIARSVSSHPNIIGLLGAGVSAKVQDVVIASLLDRTAEMKRDVTVTPVFSAVTGRMQRASAGSLISPASLATAIAEPAPAQPPLRTRTKPVGFQIITAQAPTLLDGLNAGAVGIAPAFAAAAPQACYEVFAAWKDQDQPLAAEKQQRIIEAVRLINALGPGALKFAADLNGYAGGFPRLPHLPPTGDQRDRIQQLMKPLHN